MNLRQRIPVLVLGIVAAASLTAGCATTSDDDVTSSSLEGTWKPSNGELSITYNGDGSCENAYYTHGRALDIGGPMTCHVSDNPDADGRYRVVVEQSSNENSYLVHFDSRDSATVFDSTGNTIFTMSRE